jgi:hypothetical protein
MSDARWGDPRHYGERERGDERPRVYDGATGTTKIRATA